MSLEPKVRLVMPKQLNLIKKVGIYCRVSTRSQEQLDSLTTQASTLVRLVASRWHWQLVDIYIDIRSGSDAVERQEFHRMMNDCCAGKLDIILTKNISRFGRNTIASLQAINELRSLRVEVIFEADHLSTSDPKSGLVVSILEHYVQQENEERRKNILWGMRRKAENGTSSLYARKCYGYSRDENGDLTIDQTEAAIVCDIFDMYLNGHSILSIQRELENRGIKSPTGKDKWCKRTIDTMLSNEKYSGDVIIFKTFSVGFPNTKRKINEPVQHTKYQAVGTHPAILLKEVFEAVQAEKARRSNMDKQESGSKRGPC
jgi:DNA invertase Pin-like site-specific DNA recombinase